jgi:ABC-type transporter Mla subunit MlaD
MALRIGGLPVLLGPSDLIGGAKAVLGWTDEAFDVVAGLPARLDALLTKLEGLVATIDRIAGAAAAVTENAERTVALATTVTDQAQQVVVRAVVVTQQADAAVAEAVQALGEASGLLTVFEPILEKAAPLAATFVDEFSPEELQAAIRLVDTLPTITEHVESDVLPMLATLDRVGPDIQELLGVVKDVRTALTSIPGFRLLRRQGST